MHTRLKDPVNYRLDGTEPRDPQEWSGFLSRLTDLPEAQALVNIPIDEAGIVNQAVHVQINDLAHPENPAIVPCNVNMAVNVEGKRGIHMSRCIETLMETVDTRYTDLDAFALFVAERLREVQDANQATVRVSGEHLHSRHTRVTGKPTHDKVILHSEVVHSTGWVAQKTGVTAFNMTGCPCTRTFTKFSVVPRLLDEGFSTEQIQRILEIVPSGTHTQRGTIRVLMDKSYESIGAQSLLRVLDERTHLVNEMLKRADEQDLVIRALLKPQFVEDVVRDVAAGIADTFGDLTPAETAVEIESILLDSIHIHDVRTFIRTNMGRLVSALR